MGAKNSKKNDLEKISISSVYEKSLNSNSSPENPSLNKASREDLINDSMNLQKLFSRKRANPTSKIIFLTTDFSIPQKITILF